MMNREYVDMDECDLVCEENYESKKKNWRGESIEMKEEGREKSYVVHVPPMEGTVQGRHLGHSKSLPGSLPGKSAVTYVDLDEEKQMLCNRVLLESEFDKFTWHVGYWVPMPTSRRYVGYMKRLVRGRPVSFCFTICSEKIGTDAMRFFSREYCQCMRILMETCRHRPSGRLTLNDVLHAIHLVPGYYKKYNRYCLAHRQYKLSPYTEMAYGLIGEMSGVLDTAEQARDRVLLLEG